MASIPIEWDKLFGLIPAKPAADLGSVPTDSFRQHLELSRTRTEVSAPPRPADPPRAADTRRAPEGAAPDDQSNRTSTGADPSLHTTDAPAETDDDQPAVDRNDGSAAAGAAGVLQPVISAAHADESRLALKAKSDAVVLPGGKTPVAKPVRGVVTPPVSPLAEKPPSTDVPPHQDGSGPSVTHQSVPVKPPPPRVVKESANKGQVAAKTKPNGGNLDETDEKATTLGIGAKPSVDVRQQERSPPESHAQPHTEGTPHDKSALKSLAPEPPREVRDSAADAAAGGKSMIREGAAGVPPQDVSTPPLGTDGTVSVGRLPAHVVSRTVERSTSGLQLSDTEQVRFLQRVAHAFQVAQERDGEVRLRLSPPELGSLRLEIKIQDGVLTARLEAESPAAKSLLIDNLPVLRERLAEQGIRIEHFDVDLLDRQAGGGAPQDRPQGHERNPPPAALPARFADTTHESDTQGTLPRPPIRRLGDGQLNVMV